MAEPAAEHEPAWRLSDVEGWRLDELVRAGADFTTALDLALRPDVDLEMARRLLRSGCDPDTARDILT